MGIGTVPFSKRDFEDEVLPVINLAGLQEGRHTAVSLI